MANTSSRELAEWRAFARLEPFGEPRADLRAGTIAAVTHNMNKSPKAPPVKPEDFFPSGDPEERRAAASVNLSDKIKAAFMRRG